MNELGNTSADKDYKPSVISRAEEAACEVYTYTFQGMDDLIGLFLAGYKLAEKDLAPLIEAATIVYEAWNGGTMDDVRREMAELGKLIREGKNH